MKKTLVFGLASLMLVGMMVFSSGCRVTHRSVSLWPGDRNVTVVKKPKRRKVKGRKKAVTSRSYNRVKIR